MKKTIKIICWSLLGLFVLYTFYFLWEQSQPKPIVYELITPAKRDVVKKCLATGTLEARNQVELKPQVNGIITAINVKPGQQVHAGDVVAVVKVIPDMTALNNAQGSVNSSTIDYEENVREFNRTESLYKKGVVSREEYEQAKAKRDAAYEAVKTAKSSIEVITKGASSRSGNVNTTKIVATMSGIVLAVPVKVGTAVTATSMFSQGTTVAKVADMKDIIFNGNIDETEVANLHMGMSMTLIPGAMQKVKIPGVLEYISPEGNLSNGAKMFEIHASAKIPTGVNILSGYSVNAEIELDRVNGALSVNESAVELVDGKAYVYELTSSVDDVEHQQFKRIPVTIGLSDGTYVQIKSGVTPSMHLRGIQQ